MMDAKVRLEQVYELQRLALINVNYYASRVQKLTRINRAFQFIAALASSVTFASVVREVPPQLRWLSITGSLVAAVSASVVAVLNFSETIARLERMHAAYKMLYHSAETLAKHTIGADALSPEQEAVASMLEMQLAALGPQDEIAPDKKAMKEAQEYAETQLPDSYWYPGKSLTCVEDPSQQSVQSPSRPSEASNVST
jgi:nitric oxide reductase activation protein